MCTTIKRIHFSKAERICCQWRLNKRASWKKCASFLMLSVNVDILETFGDLGLCGDHEASTWNFKTFSFTKYLSKGFNLINFSGLATNIKINPNLLYERYYQQPKLFLQNLLFHKWNWFHEYSMKEKFIVINFWSLESLI